MNIRHKHYEIIMAWAEGKDVEGYESTIDKWILCPKDRCPPFAEDCEYRIKPEPKPDLNRNVYMTAYTCVFNGEEWNLRLKFDGETGKLKKAEVIE